MLISTLLFALTANAQEAGLAVNALDLADFVTLNAEASYGFGDGTWITAGAKYNPWTFHTDAEANATRRQFQNRKRLFSAGVRRDLQRRKGWSVGAKLQWLEYNSGGFIRSTTYEGDAFGAGAYLLWSLPLSERFRLEFGAGLWGGYEYRTVYACPKCGRELSKGGRSFIRPNDLSISIKYTFKTHTYTNSNHKTNKSYEK